MNKKLINYALLLLGVVVLIIFIKNVKLEIITFSLEKLGVINISFLIGLTLINIILKALRWKFLTCKVSKTKISLGFSFASVLGGVTGGSLMPGKFELAKPLMLSTKYAVKISQSLSTLTIERILDLFTLLLITSLALFFMPAQNIISKGIVFLFIILIILITAVFAFFPKPLINLLHKLISKIPSSEKNKIKLKEFTENLFCGFTVLKEKSSIITSAVLSFLANGVEVLRFYFLMQLVGMQASLAVAGFAFAAAIIIGVITMVPGGIGITELSASEVLTVLLPSTPQAIIKTVILIDRLIAYYLLLFLGALILISYNKLFKSPLTPQKIHLIST